MKTTELYETVVNYQKENKVFFQNAENWDVRRFSEMLEDDSDKELVLQDWFQRDYCWTKDQVSALVHTLIHTPTLLPEVVLIEIDNKYYVADGHQRLRSLVIEVLRNENFKYFSKEISPTTKYFQVTPEHTDWKKFTRELERQPITVKIIKNNNLTEEQLKNLKSYVFRKWNNGKSVNAAEKRGSFPSDLNINVIQTLKDTIDEDTQKSLLVSNSIGRNSFNEFIEKMFYHYTHLDAKSDPKTKEYDVIHDMSLSDMTGKVNTFKKMFKIMSETVKEYTDKNGKFWGGCSLRDVLTFVNNLHGKGEFQNNQQYKEYLLSVLDIVQTTYVSNDKFSELKNGTSDEPSEWYTNFFSYYGKGQDSKFQHRRKYLVDNKDSFGIIGRTDKKRIFSTHQRQVVYFKQEKKCKGLEGVPCQHTNTELPIGMLEADHIIEHSMGGTTTTDNLQMLCKDCHKEKTVKFNRKEVFEIA